MARRKGKGKEGGKKEKRGPIFLYRGTVGEKREERGGNDLLNKRLMCQLLLQGERNRVQHMSGERGGKRGGGREEKEKGREREEKRSSPHPRGLFRGRSETNLTAGRKKKGGKERGEKKERGVGPPCCVG